MRCRPVAGYNGCMTSKNHALTKKPLGGWLRTLLCCAVACAAGPLHAELADRTKPMNIEADSMRYDDINKVTNATGRVVATKGTLLLRADAVEIKQDAQGNHATVATSVVPNQVFMRQKREGLNEFIEGQADRIERDEKTLITNLIGKVHMRRLVGNTLVDELHGDRLVYNEATEVYNVTGAPGAAAQPGGAPAGRVRAVIGPAGAGTAPLVAPKTGATPAGKRSAVTLQPSPKIGAVP